MKEELMEGMLSDLLARVKKIESEGSGDQTSRLLMLDRITFSLSIAFDVLSQILVDKNIISKEEMEKLITDERERIMKALNENAAKKDTEKKE